MKSREEKTMILSLEIKESIKKLNSSLRKSSMLGYSLMLDSELINRALEELKQFDEFLYIELEGF